MEINELKKMLKRSTAVLILENGDPSLVVVDYKTYRELLGEPASAETASASRQPTASQPPKPAAGSGELELLERINKDILALKEQIEEEERNLGID